MCRSQVKFERDNYVLVILPNELCKRGGLGYRYLTVLQCSPKIEGSIDSL